MTDNSPTVEDVTAQSSSAPDVTPPSSGENTDASGEDLASFLSGVLNEQDTGQAGGASEPASEEAGDQGSPDEATPPTDDADDGDDEETEDAEPEDGSHGDDADVEEDAEEEEDGADELTEAETKRLSEKTQKRIRQLTAENKQLRQYEQVAKTMLPYVEYMQTHDVPLEDMDVMVQLAGAMRGGDWTTFLKGITPYVRLAQESLGLILPPDLKQAVENGQVTKEIAQEVARQRVATQQGQTGQNTQVEKAQRENERLRAETIKMAVNQWETDLRRQDPDYSAKRDTVWRLSQALMHERGMPKTPEQAVAMAKEAYEEANKVFQRARPRKKATKPTPSSARQAPTGPGKAEPETLEEVLKGVLR